MLGTSYAGLCNTCTPLVFVNKQNLCVICGRCTRTAACCLARVSCFASVMPRWEAPLFAINIGWQSHAPHGNHARISHVMQRARVMTVWHKGNGCAAACVQFVKAGMPLHLLLLQVSPLTCSALWKLICRRPPPFRTALLQKLQWYLDKGIAEKVCVQLGWLDRAF